MLRIELPFCGAPRRTEEEQQYKTPPDLRYLIVQIEAGLILVGTWLRLVDLSRTNKIEIQGLDFKLPKLLGTLS